MARPRTKNSSFTMRIETDLLERLRVHALAERRTIANLIEVAVAEYLAARAVDADAAPKRR